MPRELQAQFAQESQRREAGSVAEDPHQGRAGDPGFRGQRVERPGPRGRHQQGCHGTGRRRRDQKLSNSEELTQGTHFRVALNNRHGARLPSAAKSLSVFEKIADGRVTITHRGSRDVAGWSMV